MIDYRMVERLVRKIAADPESPARTEKAPDKTAPEEVKEPRMELQSIHPKERRRYYFYQARPEDSIQFKSISQILQGESPEKQALVKKLSGGNSGKFFGDYFAWKKIAYVTNEYSPKGETLVAYEADLSPMGTKITNTQKISPQDAPTTVEQIEQDASLFANKRGNSDAINIDQSGESFFINAPAPNNLSDYLSRGGVPGGKAEKFEEFAKKFDYFRIWVPSINQLMLPNMEEPKADDVPGGHYKGGKVSFDAVVPKTDQEPAPIQGVGREAPVVPEPKKSPYRPAPKATAPVEGDVIDQGPGAEKMAAKKIKKIQGKDYASKPYGGGFDIVQRLIRDQHESMAIRKMAMRVVEGLVSQTDTSSPLGQQYKGKLEIETTKPDPSDVTKKMQIARKTNMLVSQQKKIDRAQSEYERKYGEKVTEDTAPLKRTPAQAPSADEEAKNRDRLEIQRLVKDEKQLESDIEKKEVERWKRKGLLPQIRGQAKKPTLPSIKPLPKNPSARGPRTTMP